MNKGSFKKGQVPWNKGKRGIHVSPETEFKTGEHVGSEHPCWKGGLQNPANDCAYLSTGANIRVRRPKVIWEEFHGKLPKGYIIYHIDGDNKNDELQNLEAITRAELLKRNNANRAELYQEEDPEEKYWRNVVTYNERHSITDDDLW